MTSLKRHVYCFCFSFLACFALVSAAEEAPQPPLHLSFTPSSPEEGYTINFNNVSIIEYLKFISEIGKFNFIYQEKDLNFNVTIVSEGATRLVDVLGALVQVLRINGFDLIEQGNNFIITQSNLGSPIATVFSDDLPAEGKHIPPIMTYVFKVKNANPAKLNEILTPFLSADAISEVSEETRHLIITDMTQNIEQIQKLMVSLDAPGTPLEVGKYTTKHNSPSDLLPLAEQIVTPLSEGNPLILVPQNGHHTIFIISTPFLTERTLSILEDLDRPPSIVSSFQGVLTGDNLLIYAIQHKSAAVLEAALRQIAADFDQSPQASTSLGQALQSIKYLRSTHAFFFIGNPTSLAEIEKILSSLDAPYSEQELNSMHQGFYIYKIKNGTEKQIKDSLNKLVKNLKTSPSDNTELVATIQSMRWIKENNSLLFLGHPRSLEMVAQLLPIFDAPLHEGKTDSNLPLSNDFFLYQPKNMSTELFINQIHTIYQDLKSSGFADPAFLHVLQSAKFSTGNTIVFTGDAQSLDRVRALASLIDGEAIQEPETTTIYIHRIQYSDYTYLEQQLNTLADSLPTTSALRQTILSAEYLQASRSLVFRGPNAVIEQIKEIFAALDDPEAALEQPSTFFVYQPTDLSTEDFIALVHKMATSMKESGFTDVALLATLKGAKLIADSKRVLFIGSPASIGRVKELLPSLDSTTGKAAGNAGRSDFFIYQPLYKTPQDILSLVHGMAADMKSGGLENSNLIFTLQSAQITANQRAILFTGSSESLAGVKKLLTVIDVASTSDASGQKPQNTSFFIYRPVNVSADTLQKGAIELATDMESSGFANELLIDTLHNAHVTSNGKAVLFIGPPDAIKELKDLLPSLDIASFVSEETSFFVYKVRYLAGEVLMEDLRNSTKDLKATTATDRQFLDAISSMRFIATTNSIIFNGTPQAIARIKTLLSHFDVASAQATVPTRIVSGYKIYKPKNVPGEQLVKILRDFEKTLLSSGVEKQALFDVVNHLQWMPATLSILISGDVKAVDEVYALLERFDIPQPGINDEGGVANFADMSFLIYKLKYHQGREIVLALRQIGQDLAKSGTEPNKALAIAINALQWIQITNSLISTGTPDTLSKLRQLIESIDIPLKQVFVEVLIVETTLGNALNFGLRWGSQGQYRNRFAYATGSFPQNTQNNPDTLSDFQQNLGTVSATTTPTGNFIPFTSGFDLGVIGDIILHKGRSYFSLGSLVDALQTEGDTLVVTNQKIVTQDNKNSTFFVGNNIPYTGSFVTNTSNQTIQTANLEYRDIGVNLSITPKVGNNDVLTLDIAQDITELVNPDVGSTTSTDNVTGITTSKTSSRTIVSVPNKSFLVLSGQVQNTKTHTKTGIPCLGGLPLVGAFFSQNDYQKNNTNLIIFIRPHIIKTFDEYKEITARQEKIYRDQTDDPESFDAALELVKTPDDF